MHINKYMGNHCCSAIAGLFVKYKKHHDQSENKSEYFDIEYEEAWGELEHYCIQEKRLAEIQRVFVSNPTITEKLEMEESYFNIDELVVTTSMLLEIVSIFNKDWREYLGKDLIPPVECRHVTKYREGQSG